MQVSRIRALRGPNLWSRHTAIEAIVSCSPEDCGLSAQHPVERRHPSRDPAWRRACAAHRDPVAHHQRVVLRLQSQSQTGPELARMTVQAVVQRQPVTLHFDHPHQLVARLGRQGQCLIDQ